MKTRIACLWTCGLTLATILLGGIPSQAQSSFNIESGQWYADYLLDTTISNNGYYFYAQSNDTVLIRVANESPYTPNIPDGSISYEDRSLLPYSNIFILGWTNEIAIKKDFSLSITNTGWYFMTIYHPYPNYPLTHDYSISILRMPHAPLCYRDMDVGPMRSGENLEGIIGSGFGGEGAADLDAATFAVSNRCTVQIRMGQKDTFMVPQLQLYDSSGHYVTNDYPPEYRAEITATLTGTGIYTAVMNEEFVGGGPYAVSLIKVGIPALTGDLDVGPIVSGETKSGTINVPGDLDAAFFTAITGDYVNITMSEQTGDDADLNPVMELFDPSGQRLIRATDDFEETARIINFAIVTNGLYTIICKDTEDRYDNALGHCRYTVMMEFLPGSPSLLLNKPLPPSNLTASDGAYVGYILVSWTASVSTNVTGYDIWRSADNVTFTQLTTNRPSTTYQDYNVQSNTPYYYKVAARNNYVISDFSNTNSGYCGTLLPAPVMALTASDGTYSNYILVSWSASGSTNVTGYDVWRKNWTNDYVLISSNWFSQAFQDNGVTPNLIYTYRVQARNSFDVSAFSPEDTGYCGTTNVLGTRRALLVGIDHYSYGPGNLSVCTNDANGVRDTMLLADPSNRWQAVNLITLTDALATKQAVRSNLFAMATASGAGDLALYFQSSHGGQSPGSNPSNTFICTHDANYSDAELGTDLALFRPETKVIIILDACFSGGMFKLDGAPATEWLFVERVMAHYQQAKEQQYKRMGLVAPKNLGANIAFMTASDYNELSWESGYYSLYTGYLLQGCSLYVPDTNQDKQYSFLELHNYAAQKTVQTRPTQHAQSYNPALLDATIARALPLNPTSIHFVNNDFDGDGASDFAAFSPATGLWRIGSLKRMEWLVYDNLIWGGPGFKALDGDYDGDRASDFTVYNPSSGEWRLASYKRGIILQPSAFFGGNGKTPVSGDYNGDKISDAALYEQPNGFWYILSTTGVPLVWGTSYAGSGFIPVSGDFDGDQINDLAMYHVSSGYWFIVSLTRGDIAWGISWGNASTVPVSGDYDGDGYSDLAVYQPATGNWYIASLHRMATIAYGVDFGGPDYIPVPGDYDGDGFFDLAVYQPATGNWYVYSLHLATVIVNGAKIGGPGYTPVLPTW